MAAPLAQNNHGRRVSKHDYPDGGWTRSEKAAPIASEALETSRDLHLFKTAAVGVGGRGAVTAALKIVQSKLASVRTDAAVVLEL
ncbi:hypothetical protein CPLU01_10227 [Colletotrichum plurivorum]|uniref:Uncharacterized protein n=1 Tax=Colletotrichum plurivorum TaxID=2175906 RepID=A0A8H6N9U3_9PEZI|nr:hypothetical protein CPLU01_10227 [Colletotrichum plurivorum]